MSNLTSPNGYHQRLDQKNILERTDGRFQPLFEDGAKWERVLRKRTCYLYSPHVVKVRRNKKVYLWSPKDPQTMILYIS